MAEMDSNAKNAPAFSDTPNKDTANNRGDAPAQTPKTAKDDADYQAFLQWKAAQQTPAQPESDVEVYAWLANGDVVRVKQSDLPGTAGTNALHGHYEKDGKTYQIVAVYPVESE